jgi:histidinol-phosphate aminotransferase
VSWVAALARPDIVALKPYDHAAWMPDQVRLHANELPWRPPGDHSFGGLNRYPEPQPPALLQRLASLYRVPPESVLAGRGSDEAIDLLVRGFCRAGQDAVLLCPPTFGMYAVAARIQGARVREVPLRASSGFALDEAAVLEACAKEVKLVFLCSPNNPTGNLLSEESILRIAAALKTRALVVVDEAYVEFAGRPPLVRHLSRTSNLALLRTLSKAHGLAGARCGILIADPEVILLLKKVIPPYAIAQLTLEAVMKLLEPEALATMRERAALIRAERRRVAQALARLKCVTRIWPSETNFLLVEFANATQALSKAAAAHLLVRDVRAFSGLAGSLRITIGARVHNDRLLHALS